MSAKEGTEASENMTSLREEFALPGGTCCWESDGRGKKMRPERR